MLYILRYGLVSSFSAVGGKITNMNASIGDNDNVAIEPQLWWISIKLPVWLD